MPKNGMPDMLENVFSLYFTQFLMNPSVVDTILNILPHFNISGAFGDITILFLVLAGYYGCMLVV